jgi:hypothetical protein
MTPIRYAPAVCQTDPPNPIDRTGMHQYPPLSGRPLSFEENVKQIEIAKARLDQHLVTTRTPL